MEAVVVHRSSMGERLQRPGSKREATGVLRRHRWNCGRACGHRRGFDIDINELVGKHQWRWRQVDILSDSVKLAQGHELALDRDRGGDGDLDSYLWEKEKAWAVRKKER